MICIVCFHMSLQHSIQSMSTGTTGVRRHCTVTPSLRCHQPSYSGPLLKDGGFGGTRWTVPVQELDILYGGESSAPTAASSGPTGLATGP